MAFGQLLGAAVDRFLRKTKPIALSMAALINVERSLVVMTLSTSPLSPPPSSSSDGVKEARSVEQSVGRVCVVVLLMITASTG